MIKLTHYIITVLYNPFCLIMCTEFLLVLLPFSLALFLFLSLYIQTRLDQLQIQDKFFWAWHTGLSLKNSTTCGCCMSKQCFNAMAYHFKSQAIILWQVISVKLNIGQKITFRNINIESRKNLACFQTYTNLVLYVAYYYGTCFFEVVLVLLQCLVLGMLLITYLLFLLILMIH